MLMFLVCHVSQLSVTLIRGSYPVQDILVQDKSSLLIFHYKGSLESLLALERRDRSEL